LLVLLRRLCPKKKDAIVKVAVSVWWPTKSPQIVIRFCELLMDILMHAKRFHNAPKTESQMSWNIIAIAKEEWKVFALHLAIIHPVIACWQ
jgi:hypothetical protein